jgi:hypothetical protein
VSAFLADVADAAMPVAVGLLIGAGAARATLSQLDHASARRLAHRYLEPLTTWCLIALGVHAVALLAAGEAGVFSLSLVLIAGGLAVLLRLVDEPEADVVEESAEPPAVPPVATAPIPVSEGPLWARPGRHSAEELAGR